MSEGMYSSRELRLGDYVEASSRSGFGSQLVIAVTENFVRFFRPYVHNADFSMIGTIEKEKGESVIPFIGIEEYNIYKDDHKCYKMIKRSVLK